MKKKIKDAIEAYEESADCHLSNDKENIANKMYVEAATWLGQLDEPKSLEKGVKYLEKAARDSLDDKMGKWSVKKYLFKAGILRLLLGKHNNNLNEVDNKIHSYEDMAPLFKDTRESKLLIGVCEAMMKGDVDIFAHAIEEFDSLGPLDVWHMDRLVQVKEYFGDSKIATDAVPDFTQDLGADNICNNKKEEDDDVPDGLM